jgi:hypothetical protein
MLNQLAAAVHRSSLLPIEVWLFRLNRALNSSGALFGIVESRDRALLIGDRELKLVRLSGIRRVDPVFRGGQYWTASRGMLRNGQTRNRMVETLA